MLQAMVLVWSYVRRLWPALVAIGLLCFVVQMLYDVEYAGQDLTIRGLRIFSWARGLAGKPPLSADKDAVVGVPLFAEGVEKTDAGSITQGGVYDCRFLAELASFLRTPRGKQAIATMISENGDGTFTVTFPGTPDEPVRVEPLTATELKIYATSQTIDKRADGLWLPVVEKAYGEYRIRHQNPAEHVLRFIKHGLFEWRWTSRPELTGFGASYGAKDDKAVFLLTGHDMRRIPTTSVEIGEYGLAKGYVTSRQIRSWFDRRAVVKEMLDEQDAWLRRAIAHGAIITATTEIAASEAHGLFSNHAYTVLGYNPDSRELLIRDVMGKCDLLDERTGRVRDGRLDGIFVVSLGEFNRYFSHINIEEVP
jgi:hypothetical protein